ncbi:hypothetical protein, partial [Mycobacterium tuberculosis]|uniref:hypothetical protein n=1 Tax=Mycobacterium tuberculosis TaxID=1773 RepID=UPI00214E5906
MDSDHGDGHAYSVNDARFEVVRGYLKLKDGHSVDYQNGDTVSVTVTVRDAAGESYSETFVLNAQGDAAQPVPVPVWPPAPSAPNATIAISGEAKIGNTLHAHISDADGVSGSPVYQWYADGQPIAG